MSHRAARTAALAALLLGLSAGAAQAATYRVSDTTDTPVGQDCGGTTGCTLREAITSANATPGVPDIVEVAAGTYALTENAELSVTDDLTIRGTGGSVVVDAGDDTRVVYGMGFSTDLELQGLTIRGGAENGSPALGGGIRADGPLTLRNVVVHGNTVTSGGGATGAGVYASTAVTVSDSTIRDNVALAGGIASGAGLYANGMATLTNVDVLDNTAQSAGTAAQGGGVAAMAGLQVSVSRVSGNSATASSIGAYGGGLLASAGTFALQSSVVRQNTASGPEARGGGLWRAGGSATEILSSRLTDNTVTGGAVDGGGAFLNAAGATIAGSTVDANDAVATGSNNGATGGGLSVGFTADVAATNTTIAGNTVRAEGTGNSALGGGLFVNGGGLTLVGATLSGNFVSGNGVADEVAGGGVAATGAATTLPITGSIVSGNVQPDPSADCANATLVSGGGNVVNQVGGAASCAFTPAAGDVVTNAPGLDPLGDYAGLTPTMRLTPSSPALDRYSGGTCPSTDQRGIARPQGAACDAGAFEARPARVMPDLGSLSFGTLAVGATSAPQTVTLANGGDLPTTGLAPGLGGANPGDFALSNDTCPAALAPQATCAVDVRFAPTADGGRAASLTGPDNTVALSGTGTGGPIPPTPPAGGGGPAPACDELDAAIGFETAVTFALRCSPMVWHWEIVDAPQHGHLSRIDREGRVIYTPRPGFSGDDAFRYRALGPGGASAPAIVRVTVGPGPAPAPAPTSAPVVVEEPTAACPSAPRLIGRTMKGVRRVLARAGCEDVALDVTRRGPRRDGPRRVVRQTPEQGSAVPAGGRIAVTLR